MERFGKVMGFRSDETRRAYLDAYEATCELSTVPFESVDVPTPFGSTHVKVAGPAEAPPLVVLHGKHCSLTMWLELLPVFAETHRTYLVDSVGELGRSIATRMMYRSDHVVRWIDSVLIHFGAGRAALVGLSNGAFLAGTYATKRPERVERLAMLAPVGVVANIRASWWLGALAAMGNPARYERFWGRHSVNQHRSEVQDRFDHQALIGNAGMRFATRDMIIRKYSRHRLASLSMPVLVLLGDDDIIISGAQSLGRTRRLLPDARVELLANCGHMVNFDRLDAASALLSEFLRESPGSGTAAGSKDGQGAQGW